MPIIPVFVSSTFRDFHAERDELVATVLPALNDRAAKHGCRVELIDLRWGITTESPDDDARQARVLSVCLSEIDRARPLFVGLVGDRYGWVPEDYRLERAAREARISQSTRGLSVTALEFEHGAMQHPGEDAVFFVRELVGSAPHDWQDGDTCRIAALRQRIRERCECKDYRVEFGSSGISDLSEFTSLATQVIGDIVERRAQQIAGRHADPVDVADSLFFEDRLRAFDGNNNLVETLLNKVIVGRGACLIGESGIGKSAIWCATVDQLRHTGARVVAIPVGASPEVITSRTVIVRAAGMLGEHAPDDVPDDRLILWFSSLLKDNGPLVLAIDGIDALHDSSWQALLGSLPTTVTLFTSTTIAQQAGYLASLGTESVPVLRLTADQTRDAIDAICRSIGRSLPPEAVDAIAAEQRSPLWLRLAVGELSALDAEDFRTVDPRADPLDELARLMTSTVRDLPASADELVSRVVARASERHGEDNVAAVLRFTSISRSGLRPLDLEELAGLDGLAVAGIRRSLSEILIPRGTDGRLGFTHAIVRDRIYNEFAALVDERSVHSRIADHLGRHLDGDQVCAADQLWHLFRSARSGAAEVLDRAGPERWEVFSDVIIDSATINGFTTTLNGIGVPGIDLLARVGYEHRQSMRSDQCFFLGTALFRVAREAYERSMRDLPEMLPSLVSAATRLADLSSVEGRQDEERSLATDALSFAESAVRQHPDLIDAHQLLALISTWHGRAHDYDSSGLASLRIAVAEWNLVAQRRSYSAVA